jgi:hypothetical protein
MKKNTTIILIAGAAVAGYLIYKKMKNGTPGATSKSSMVEDNAEDKATAMTTDGTSATAMTTSTGETAVRLPGGVTISPAQAQKLKGKLKTVALSALAKLKSKRRKKSNTAMSGFQNLPILF